MTGLMCRGETFFLYAIIYFTSQSTFKYGLSEQLNLHQAQKVKDNKNQEILAWSWFDGV